ncbi:MAG: DNA-binding protein WhiA [Christensenellaceae bacterium]
MSFSSDAKDEICTTAAKDCCIMAEFFAITFVCGNLSINSLGVHINYHTENMAVAKRIYSTTTRILKLDADIEVKDNLLKKKHTYTIVVNNAELLLSTLGMGKNLFATTVPPDYMLKKSCCRTSILRGAFLGCGSVSNPKKNYHLEFVVNSEEFANTLLKILQDFEINAKKIIRKQNFVVYLNEGDSIATLLTLIGAHTSILNFENVRVLKEMRNNVNRAVNCETANIDKTINAAMTQLHSIRLIDKNLGIENLKEPLRQAAQLRLENPDATLLELCALCDTTKSGMNHRLRKLNEIAQKYLE